MIPIGETLSKTKKRSAMMVVERFSSLEFEVQA